MSVWELLFPRKCILCGTVLQKESCGVCVGCHSKLPVIREPRCLHCGKPIESIRQEYCMDCAGRVSSLDGGITLWEYTDSMRQVMADFKYGGCESDAEFFANEFAAYHSGKLQSWNIQAIVPVPLHWRKRWFRGYNQAESFASALGQKLSVPVYTEVLKRVRYTEPQKGLDSRQRRKNLQRAFDAAKNAENRINNCTTILLVDDIYTTGATLEACAGVLRRLGVQRVYFTCLCTGRGF